MSTQKKEEELFKYLSYTKGITDRDKVNAEITKMALLCPPHIANECENDEDMTFTIMHNADVSYHDWSSANV